MDTQLNSNLRLVRDFKFIILHMILLLTFIQTLNSEVYHSGRDFSGGQNRAAGNTHLVRTYDQCKKYLCKYGYLMKCDCQQHLMRKKRQALEDGLFPTEMNGASIGSEHNPLPVEPTRRPVNSNLPICNELNFTAALKQFQQNYHLEVDGVCGNDTKEAMSSWRCGQPDVIDPALKEEANHIEELKQSEQRSRRSLSELLQTSASDVEESAQRRKKQFEGYMEEIKNEVRENHYRGKRELFNVTISDKWPGLVTKSRITWRLMYDHYSHYFSPEVQRSLLSQSFRYWSEVSPVCFVEDTISPQVDIEIGFLEGSHLGCEKTFDGTGGEVAHKSSVQETNRDRDVHFDGEEVYWVKGVNPYVETGNTINLLVVAVHELGHVLGLNHSDITESVMNAMAPAQFSHNVKFELTPHDRAIVKAAYGPCSGSFDTAFDYTRWSTKPSTGERIRIFSTYFFRQDHYWMYDNGQNRARYGDPILITPEWSGLPVNIDAFVHFFKVLLTDYGVEVVDEHMFFKGSTYYIYSSDLESVISQGSISSKFPTGSIGESIPNNLDSAFFDLRDHFIYFFKNQWVYTYKYIPDSPGSHSCCERKQLIKDLLPPSTNNDLYSPEGNSYSTGIDSIYFSYTHKKLFVIKGDDVWENVLFSMQGPRGSNGMKYLGKWNERWNYLCDVKCPV